MEYDDREFQRDCEGPEVAELQLRLSGFRGTMPDGEFGPGTERQVINFQRDYTRMPQPNGKADAETLRAVDKFADAYPFDFGKLKCPCGQCAGFGSGKDKGVYLHACPPSVSCPEHGVHQVKLPWAQAGIPSTAPALAAAPPEQRVA